MTLVNHIDLVATLHWGTVPRSVSDVIHPGVAGGVDFNHIQGGWRFALQTAHTRRVVPVACRF